MRDITINGQKFDIDAMSEETQRIIASIQIVDNELKRLRATEAALIVSRMTYGNSLMEALDLNEGESEISWPENISFD